MKTQVKISEHAAEAPAPHMNVPRGSSAIDVRAAANEELKSQKRDTTENPLWVINIAMAAFFIVTGLVIMTS